MKNYSYAHEVKCLHCSSVVVRKTKQKQPPKFCSNKCVGEYAKKDKSIPSIYSFKCQTCGIDKTVNMHQYRKGYPKYCSKKCVGEASKASDKIKWERAVLAFEKDVIKKNGCWGWSGFITKKGYACVSGSGKNGQRKAHRISYEIHKGEILEGLQILHKCDNRMCTNPDHLFLGTNKDNSEDCAKKLRKPCKLTKEQVIHIKTLLKNENLYHREIAEIVGVKRENVSSINQGKVWNHVEI